MLHKFSLKWLAIVVLLFVLALPAATAGAAAPASPGLDPTYINCDPSTSVALNAASAMANCDTAAQPAVIHRVIEGRWHTYNDPSLAPSENPTVTGYLYSAAPMFRTDLNTSAAPQAGYLYSAAPMFRTDLNTAAAPQVGYLYSAAPMFRTDLANR